MMSAEPFKVMVIGEVAPACDALIPFLRAVGFVAENGDGRTTPQTQSANRSSDLAVLDIENLTGISASDLCGQIRAIANHALESNSFAVGDLRLDRNRRHISVHVWEADERPDCRECSRSHGPGSPTA